MDINEKDLESFEKIINYNKKIIKSLKKFNYNLIREIWDLENKLFWSYFLIILNRGQTYGKLQVVTGSIYKNLILLYSSLSLNNKGLYGSATALLRTVLEFLLIAKFASLSDDKTVLNKWLNQPVLARHKDTIQMQKEIFDKIQKPNTIEFKTLYKTFHMSTHATHFSQQASINVKHVTKEVILTNNFILMLLECNYHLINSYFIKMIPDIGFIEYYSPKDKKQEIKQIKNRLKQIFKLTKSKMSKKSRKFIYDYKLKWKIKNPK